MKAQDLNKRIAQLLIAAVFTTFCGISELAQAQAADPQSTQTQPAQSQPSAPAIAEPPASSTQPSTAPQNTTPPGGTVDPSAGPLAPVPSTQQQQQQQLPNAPSSETREQAPTAPPQQPVGAAGAQVGPTAGGLAAKPAGNAIAPAKQHQVRSFLIKMGAIAAAGAAIGTVVALSRGTSPNPPGTR